MVYKVKIGIIMPWLSVVLRLLLIFLSRVVLLLFLLCFFIPTWSNFILTIVKWPAQRKNDRQQDDASEQAKADDADPYAVEHLDAVDFCLVEH